MKKLIISAVLAVMAGTLGARNTVGIIVDRDTYSHCRTQMDAFEEQLVSEGLNVHVESREWQSPEDVKDVILSLAASRRNPLEGVMLVGDVPIVMVREAQWLTSAFKMNEDRFPVFESSVASDRFYDCFDLSFEFVAKDTDHDGVFYYRLTEDGSQTLSPDIYSSRVKVPQVMIDSGADKYDLIARFFEKAVAAHRENNPLDRIAFYFGAGYNSEDMTVWRQRPIQYKEYFPGAFKKASGNRFLSFRQQDVMKKNLITELSREDMDLFQFTEHGAPDVQYLSPYGVARSLAEDLSNLREKNDSIAERNANFYQEDLINVHCNPRVVILNACFNGSFHNPEGYIAGVYVFGPGKCVVAQGNTVNALQDKWDDKQLGLLSLGVRAGYWQREQTFLESHLIGDPTFRFSGNGVAMEKALLQDKPSTWKKLIKSADPRVRSAAVLHGANSESAIEFLKNDTSLIVRTAAFNVLRDAADGYADEAILLALHDPFELIVRQGCRFAAERASAGRDSCVVKALFDVLDNHKELLRVQWVAKDALSVILGREYFDAEVQKIADTSLPDGKRIFSIRPFRNSRYPAAAYAIKDVALDRNASPELRKVALEALGWYDRTDFRSGIAEALSKAGAEETDMPAQVRCELGKTVKRLSR